MPVLKNRFRPGVERLNERVVMSASVAASATLPSTFRPVPGSVPSANPSRTFSPADLQAYATAYLSSRGSADFSSQDDFNGTGFIGQPDATPILRGLAAMTPKIPLTLSLGLASGDQVQGHHPADSGGVTRLGTVTVIGKTTPNSIVFIDGPTSSPNQQPTGNFKFEGGALATNAQGIFDYQAKLPAVSRGGSLLSVSFLIRTPFNQQLIRTYPILRIR